MSKHASSTDISARNEARMERSAAQAEGKQRGNERNEVMSL